METTSLHGPGALGGPDRRPTFLALGMLVAYGLILVIEPARQFFELSPLPLGDVAAIGLAAG